MNQVWRSAHGRMISPTTDLPAYPPANPHHIRPPPGLLVRPIQLLPELEDLLAQAQPLIGAAAGEAGR